MRRAAVAPTRFRFSVALLSAAMLACSAPASPKDPQDGAGLPLPGGPLSDVATMVVNLTNGQRERAGVAALASHASLMRAAQIHAEQMAQTGRLEHLLADARYPRLEDRLAAVGYRWQSFAENVAFGQRTAAEVVNGWMQSPGHRANILNATYTEMGAGYARDSSARPYWVQVFGKPIS